MADVVVVDAGGDSEEPRRPPRTWHDVMHPEGRRARGATTHEELMALGGLYAELFTLQARAYLGN